MEVLLLGLILVGIVYISRTHKLAGKVARLEHQLEQLTPVQPLRQPQSQVVPIPNTSSQVTPSEEQPVAIPSTTSSLAPWIATLPAPELQTSSNQPVVARSREEWEMLVAVAAIVIDSGS